MNDQTLIKTIVLSLNKQLFHMNLKRNKFFYWTMDFFKQTFEKTIIFSERTICLTIDFSKQTILLNKRFKWTIIHLNNKWNSWKWKIILKTNQLKLFKKTKKTNKVGCLENINEQIEKNAKHAQLLVQCNRIKHQDSFNTC